MGQPWGDDEIGQLIGVAYQEVVAWAFDCLRDVLTELREAGTDLIGQAAHWDQQEDSVTTSFESFFGPLTGSGSGFGSVGSA